MKNEQMSRTLEIFKTVLKFGCFTFGGGWSIVAQIQKEYLEKKHWITDEELLDFTSVGRSTPGLMIGNASVLFGYHVAGVSGAGGMRCVSQQRRQGQPSAGRCHPMNPNRHDLLECLQKADCVPLKTIEELRDIAYAIVGEPEPVQFEDRIVGIIEARDGTIMDVVRQVKHYD